MERKEWVKKFIRLVQSGATALDYRRELRIFPQQLKGHLAKLGDYKAEFKAIEAEEEAERLEKERKAKEVKERLAKARAAKEEKRLEALKAKEEEDGRPDVESDDPSDDKEALGTREDTDED